MSFKNQKYSEEKMNKHLEYLKMYEAEGEPLDYEILIDGMKAIRRTSNTNRFPLFSHFIHEDTQKIELFIFQGTSNHNDKYIYYLKDAPQEDQSLGDIDHRIEEKVKEAERKWQFTQLQERNTTLEKEIKDLEAEVASLEKENEAIVNKQSPLKGILGEVGASFFESFIRNNPQIAGRIPGGQALAGLLEKEVQSIPIEETEATFKPKTANTEDEGILTFARELRQSFQQQEFASVLDILQKLAEDKTKITSTLNFLNHEQI